MEPLKHKKVKTQDARILAIIVVLIVLWPSISNGCDCAPSKSLEESYNDADFVFLVDVVDVLDDQVDGFKSTVYYMTDSNYIDKAGFHPKFKILNVVKGNIQVEYYNYQSNWSNCDVLFEKGKKYVIFGYRDDQENISTNICTATFILETEQSKNKWKSIKKWK